MMWDCLIVSLEYCIPWLGFSISQLRFMPSIEYKALKLIIELRYANREHEFIFYLNRIRTTFLFFNIIIDFRRAIDLTLSLRLSQWMNLINRLHFDYFNRKTAVILAINNSICPNLDTTMVLHDRIKIDVIWSSKSEWVCNLTVLWYRPWLHP